VIIKWCESHKMRWDDPEHHIAGHYCVMVEKEIHVA